MTDRSARTHDHGDRPAHGMRPLKALLPLDEALLLCAEAAPPVDRAERVSLEDAPRRVAAEEIRAPRDVPLADRAAMDGYAVRALDTKRATKDRPASLRCVAAVFAGDRPATPVGTKECAQIATGATVPDGADAVVMVEDTDRDGDCTLVYRSSEAGDNISRRGSDLRPGDPVVAGGEWLTPAKVGALAAVGRGRVLVYRRPRVAILTTGDEVVAPGRPIRAGQVYDINSYTLSAVVRENGGEPLLLGRIPDRLEAVQAALRKALTADLAVVSGGSSVGTKDLLIDAVRSEGEILFHGVAIRPGRPTILGRCRGRPVLGMPGNPTSCLNNAYVFLAPMLRRMARRPPAAERSVRAPLAAPMHAPPDKVAFLTVRLEDGRAVPAYKESGAITSMSRADGYVVLPAGGRAEAGEAVDVVLF